MHCTAPPSPPTDMHSNTRAGEWPDASKFRRTPAERGAGAPADGAGDEPTLEEALGEAAPGHEQAGDVTVETESGEEVTYSGPSTAERVRHAAGVLATAAAHKLHGGGHSNRQASAGAPVAGSPVETPAVPPAAESPAGASSTEAPELAERREGAFTTEGMSDRAVGDALQAAREDAGGSPGSGAWAAGGG